jgi:hypothetical protein
MVLTDLKLQSNLPPELNDLIECNPVRVSKGIYKNTGFNLHNQVNRKEWGSPYQFADIDPNIPTHGVADSIEQFVEKYDKLLEDSPHEYVVGFQTVRKNEQSSTGGWRWHKWGEYIGVHKITTEYLYDEPVVEEVVCFSVLVKADKTLKKRW